MEDLFGIQVLYVINILGQNILLATESLLFRSTDAHVYALYAVQSLQVFWIMVKKKTNKQAHTHTAQKF